MTIIFFQISILATPTISHTQFKRITEKVITLSRRTDNSVFTSLFQVLIKILLLNFQTQYHLQGKLNLKILVKREFFVWSIYHIMQRFRQKLSVH